MNRIIKAAWKYGKILHEVEVINAVANFAIIE